MVNLAAFADELEKVAAPDQSEHPSLLRRLIPAALGVAAGLGAYKYLRKVRLSGNPAMAAIQRQAKGALTHVEELNTDQLSTRLQSLGQRFSRGVDQVIEEPMSYRTTRHALLPADVFKQRKTIQGAVLPMGDAKQVMSYAGDLNLNSNPHLAVKLENKINEAQLLKSLPGGAPQSTPLATYLHRTEPSAKGLDDLQRKLSEKYPAGYVVKPIDGVASGGVPTHKDSFSSIFANGHGTTHQQWMTDMMRRPENFMVQEYIPIKKSRRWLSKQPLEGGKGGNLAVGKEVADEWRVHIARGQVVPGATMHRWTYDAGMSPRSRKEISDVNRFMQENLDRMPESAHGVPMAADVVRTTDGKLKIIELNAGGNSGLLMAPVVRGKGWGYYKGITGRHSQPEALVKGIGAAAATATAGSALQPNAKKNGT